MNILILGDFSSLAINLKAGFKELGHRVVNVRTTDGFKNYVGGEDDIIYTTNRRLTLFGVRLPKTHLLTAISDNRQLRKEVCSICEFFNLIIIINEVFVSTSIFYAGISIDYILGQKACGAKIVMCSCGGNTALRMFGKMLKYNHIAFPEGRKYPSGNDIKKFNKILDCADIVCPISYSYWATIKKYCERYGFDKKIECLSVPIVLDEYEFNSCYGRKVVIFHGKSRPDKGSYYIEEALKRIQDDFSELVEILVFKPMEYAKYVKQFDRIDILIDQTNGYGIGMNAALGLMKGLVVLGGNEPEDNECMGRISPVINITPDSNQIYNVLSDLLLNKQLIDTIKKESRSFAVNYLSATVVARNLLDYLN